MRSLPPQASGILSYFTRHRTAANLVLVALIVAGLFALPNMRAQFFPDVVVDDIDISTRWDGAGAEDVDAAIVGVPSAVQRRSRRLPLFVTLMDAQSRLGMWRG